MFKRYITYLLLCFSVLISACSSNKLVKTYPGEKLPESSVAVLTAPENITLLSVNGQAVTQYLLSNLEVRYALEEGKNLIVFQYESIWGKAIRDSETGSRVEVVKSRPLEVLINARAGEQYRFNFMPADNQKEAEALAQNFVAQIVDAKDNLVAESLALGSNQKADDERAKKEKALLIDKAEAAEVLAGKAKTDGITVIDRLKALWAEANAEQKKAFMVWVFQE